MASHRKKRRLVPRAGVALLWVLCLLVGAVVGGSALKGSHHAPQATSLDSAWIPALENALVVSSRHVTDDGCAASGTLSDAAVSGTSGCPSSSVTGPASSASPSSSPSASKHPSLTVTPKREPKVLSSATPTATASTPVSSPSSSPTPTPSATSTTPAP